MREIMFMVGTLRMDEPGDVSARYYQAIVGVGYPIGNDRILRRKWKTKSEATKYLIDFYFTWSRLHNEKIEA